MALDPVPWFVGSPAEHSAESARQLLWNATGGRTGIASKSDFHVKQLSTPGGAVRIMPGGGVIESTYAGASQQSYAVRSTQATDFEIPANNDSTAKTYYVFVEIRDPHYAGSKPEDEVNGPYNFFDFDTKKTGTHPRLVFAQVKLPANTAAITNAMITDLRELVAPRREEKVFARPRVTADGGENEFLHAELPGRGEWFPGGNGDANAFTFTVPEWATRVVIEGQWLSIVENANKNVAGRFWMEYGDERNTDGKWGESENVEKEYEFKTQTFGFNTVGRASGDEYTTNWILADTKTVPANIRGKEVKAVFKAAYTGGADVKKDIIHATSTSGLFSRFTFIEAPEGDADDTAS